MTTSTPHRLLLWVAIAVVLRAAFVLYHAHIGWHLRFDPGYYLTLAHNLEHGVYSLFHPQDIPDTTRMPGYPLLIHLLGCSIPAVLILQVLLSSAKVVLVHKLALRIGLAPRAALFAAALMAIEPVDILLTGSLLTETGFTVALLAGTVLLLDNPDHGGRSMLSALCFVVAGWFRANGLVLALWAIALMVPLMRMDLKRAVGFALGVVMLMAPWVVRNHLSTGRAILSDSGPVATAYFHVPEVLAWAGDARAASYRTELQGRAERTAWEDKAGAARFFDGLRQDVRRTFTEHPVAWCAVQLRDAAGIYLAPGLGHITGFLGTRAAIRPIQALAIAYSVLLVVALVVWTLRVRQMPAPLMVMLLLAAGIVLSGGISTTDARFKAPAMPFLLVGAAWAVEQLSPVRASSSIARLRWLRQHDDGPSA